MLICSSCKRWRELFWNEIYRWHVSYSRESMYKRISKKKLFKQNFIVLLSFNSELNFSSLDNIKSDVVLNDEHWHRWYEGANHFYSSRSYAIYQNKFVYFECAFSVRIPTFDTRTSAIQKKRDFWIHIAFYHYKNPFFKDRNPYIVYSWTLWLILFVIHSRLSGCGCVQYNDKKNIQFVIPIC